MRSKMGVNLSRYITIVYTIVIGFYIPTFGGL